MTKKNSVLWLGLSVILVLTQRSFGTDESADGPNQVIPPIATSVMTGPILSSAVPPPDPQDRPGSRFRAQQKVDNAPLNAAKVRKSIQRGIQYLKENQLDDGSWKDSVGMDGGTTGLCLLALLNSEDLPPDSYKNSDHVKNALDYLSDVPAAETYVVSLRIMVMAAADPKGKVYRRQINDDVDWLVTTQVPQGKPSAGGWNYGTKGPGDSSNTQFALLGLHEASKIGIEVPQETWQRAQDYWENCFHRSGGFTYYARDGSPRGSMTCAGIASVIITQENLVNANQLVNGDFANCCVADGMKPIIDQAFQWLSDHYTVRANPYSRHQDPKSQLYYLYGLERAGRLAGRRFVGPHDWYRDGAKELLKDQNPLNDYWVTQGGHGERDPLIATSFALLFLSKGKRPVVIGKYNHGAPDWDLHPNGVHYLTRRLEKEWGGIKLNWQTVKAENATVDDLLETPVLFMSGKELFNLEQTEKDNLKKYLENGGFLFAEACQGDGCGNDAKYHQAFVELMREIFPDSQLEPLARNHPIWNSHFPLVANADQLAERPLLGLQACCRTSVVYCPKNLSCYWNLDRPAVLDDANVSALLKSRVDYCSKLGVNVMSYATDRFSLKEKGETPTLIEKKHELLADRVLVFPKLQHGGGADDAPNAWRNVLRNVERLGLEIKLDKKMIPAAMDELADHPFVFMHGRNAFTLSAAEVEALRKHLEFGGFIFADSICASQEFTDSFRRAMKEVVGSSLLPITPDHEIWTDKFDGYTIDRVTMRVKTPGGTFQEEVKRPELEGAEINGRLAVVFSPVDLSCALENTAKSQCTGYSHQDALRIGTNVIMYSLLSD